MDPSNLYQAIASEPFYHRMTDNIFYKLLQAKMFTIADFIKGNYHIVFDEAISFLTPFGQLGFTRMSFGLTVTGDEFQHKLDAVFSNLDFCTCTANDMIIWREQPDSSGHYKCLTPSLQAARKHNLKLNISKLQYKTKHASFFRTSFTSHDHKLDNENIPSNSITKNCQRPPVFLGHVLSQTSRAW